MNKSIEAVRAVDRVDAVICSCGETMELTTFGIDGPYSDATYWCRRCDRGVEIRVLPSPAEPKP